MTASLAYRRNQKEILRGEIPTKYSRILPYIPAGRVLEIGAAEGVLSLLLAKSGREVISVEPSEERYKSAQELALAWAIDTGIRFVNGKVEEHLNLLRDIDVLVAVRTIYYLGARLDEVFSEVSKHVPHVLLCGNRNRANKWRSGHPHPPLLEDNRYAAREGMRDLLERHGYEITHEVTEGDEIIVGVRR